MGEQTCAVLVGFVVIHIALILSLVSLTTPVWIEATANSTTPGNGTNEYTKGLWEICELGECSKVNQTLQTASFRASQVLFTMGTGLLTFGVLGMYTYLAVQAFRTSLKISVLSMLNIMIASFSFLTSIIVFSMKAKSENADWPEDLEPQLGWSYITGAVATVFSFVAVFSAVKRTRTIANRDRGYEEL